MEDLERFTRRIRLEGVSCGQKSYKSEQIEQIDNDKKKIWRIWKDLEDFSAQPTERECVSRHRILTNRDKSNK